MNLFFWLFAFVARVCGVISRVGGGGWHVRVEGGTYDQSAGGVQQYYEFFWLGINYGGVGGMWLPMRTAFGDYTEL